MQQTVSGREVGPHGVENDLPMPKTKNNFFYMSMIGSKAKDDTKIVSDTQNNF